MDSFRKSNHLLNNEQNPYKYTTQVLNTSDYTPTRTQPYQITDRSPLLNNQFQNNNNYNYDENSELTFTYQSNGVTNKKQSINLPSATYNQQIREKYSEYLGKQQQKELYQKTANNNFALPIIAKKNSISEVDILISDQAKQNHYSIVSNQQKEKINQQWSPLPSATMKGQSIGNYTKILAANNNLSPRGLGTFHVQQHQHFDILERDELIEEIKSDQNSNEFNDTEQIDMYSQDGQQQQQMMMLSLNHKDSKLPLDIYNKKNEIAQKQYMETLPLQLQTIVYSDVKNPKENIYNAKTKVISENIQKKSDYKYKSNPRNEKQQNLYSSSKKLKNSKNQIPNKFINDQYQDSNQDKTVILDVSERSRKSNTQMTEMKQTVNSQALNMSQNRQPIIDQQKLVIKKSIIPMINTTDLLQKNQFNPNNNQDMSNQNIELQKKTNQNETKTIKKISKKINQSQKREDDIKKYFQANMNSHLHFTGTEFSTPGASSKFLEEYQLDEKSLLGTGGYAEVRLATHKKSGHQVAIKIYEKYKLIDPQIKQNLIREIKILNRLDHPNIMKLYESIDTLSNVYLINEYVRGMPLNDYMRSLDPQKMNEIDALHILKQLIDAIAYLHSKNICHRDIKLENIIIDQDTKQIKIIDFGFAVYSTKPLKLYCGTPSYMAPEIILKKEYKGAAVDIWTIGIAFYVMICGNFPFTAHTERELTKKIQAGIYHVPKEMTKFSQMLLQKMLTVDPNNRANANELLNEINDQNLSTFDQTPQTFKSQMDKTEFNTQLGQQLMQFEKHLDNGRGKQFQRSKQQLSPRVDIKNPQSNLDEDTKQHLLKLGYNENDIMQKYNNDKDMIGILYKRLLSLKSTTSINQ